MERRSLFSKTTAYEDELLAAVSMDEAWALIERYSTLKRHSGDPDEYVATAYLRSRLSELGVPFVSHKAHLYLSVPRRAEVIFGSQRFYAKTPSFSVSTGPAGLTAPLVYIPEESPDGFRVTPEFSAKVSGKIVVTEWPPDGEMVVHQLMQAGAVGAIFVQPALLIHEDTVTTIWGNPELTTSVRIPKLPVVNVSNSDGAKIIAALASSGDSVSHLGTLVTEVETGWKDTDIVVAEIPGTQYPDEFVLLHGHLDSWHMGIGDNAVGNGAMLEIARVLWTMKDKLKRTVRLAWWTGHSTGRYAGSTWFADHYALDLVDHCVAHMNCDSPGCRWATDLTGVCSMAELVEFTKQAVMDISGQEARPGRPHRAGDYSFHNLGISATMMLSSKIPDEVKAEKGLHGVGGCGGNNEWHTEEDDMAIADKALLLRDTKLYALMTWRLANLELHPTDYSKTASEIASFAATYRDMLPEPAASRVSLGEVVRAAQNLAEDLAAFYRSLDGTCLDASRLDAETVRAINVIQRRLARELVEVDYTKEGRFHQDPATPLDPLPDLAYAKLYGQKGWPQHLDETGFAEVSLIRGKNRVLYRLGKAAELLSEAKLLCQKPV